MQPDTHYDQFFNSNRIQNLPLPIREKSKLVGYEWVEVDLVDVLSMIPDYSVFTDPELYYFDTDEYNKFTNFVVNECVYPEGVNAGKPFVPELWQWAILLNILCWKEIETGNRRYREAFIFVPRKNGKTSCFGVVLTLYMVFCDKEQRSQNFCCAADIEQASVNFRHVAYNIEVNKHFSDRLINKRVNRSTRSFENTNGNVFKVLSSIADTKHGLSPNFVYADEIHAHKDGDLIDVMVTGTASRPEALIVYTTTSDYDRKSVCNDLYSRSKKIIAGHIVEKSFLPVIYEATLEDDYRKEEVWRKSNPNFGISIYPDYFKRQISVCESSPVHLNRFLRLHLNIRTKTETVWIPSWVWANGNGSSDDLMSVKDIKDKLYEFRDWHTFARTKEFGKPTNTSYIQEYRVWFTWYFNKLEELRHSPCWGGFDNSSTNDIAAFTLYFPEERCVIPWFWVPAESIDRRSKEDRVAYDRWYRSGVINHTPLARISEIDIGNALIGDGDNNKGICTYFSNINRVSFDTWNANYIYEIMYKYGINAKGYPLTFAAMNEPCNRLETMVTNKEFFHGSNPVLEWMITNSMMVTNNSNQMRIDKNKSTDKVDGIVSLLMAIGGYIHTDSNIIENISGLSV